MVISSVVVGVHILVLRSGQVGVSGLCRVDNHVGAGVWPGGCLWAVQSGQCSHLGVGVWPGGCLWAVQTVLSCWCWGLARWVSLGCADSPVMLVLRFGQVGVSGLCRQCCHVGVGVWPGGCLWAVQTVLSCWC